MDKKPYTDKEFATYLKVQTALFEEYNNRPFIENGWQLIYMIFVVLLIVGGLMSVVI